MRPQGVLFDFDGVIVNSLLSHLKAWDTAAFVLFGQEIDKEILASLSGRSTVAIARDLAAHFGAPSRANELADLKRHLLVESGGTVPLIAGVRECLSHLMTEEIPYGIASNAPRDYILHLLSAHGLHVPVVLGIEDAGHPKPSPELYLLCAKRLMIGVADHGRTLVFEDSVHGLTAGVRAGMVTIGVTTDTPKEPLIKAGAHAACANLAEALSNGWFTQIPTKTDPRPLR